MGVNESLCLDQNNNPTYDWCLYQVIDDYSLFVEYAFMGTVLVIFIAALIFFHMLRKVHIQKKVLRLLLNDTTSQVLGLIIFWSLCSILKIAINLTIYELYMREDFQQIGKINNQHMSTILKQSDRSPGEPIVVFSSIFYFLDYLCPYTLLFLLFFVPYKWLKTTLLYSDKYHQIPIQLRKKLEWVFLLLTIYRYEIKAFMIVLPIILILHPFVLFFTSIGCVTPKYISLVVQAQSLIILLFYLLGICIIKFMKNWKLIQLTSSHFKKIKIEYFLLLSAVVVRIAIGYFFKLSNFYDYTPNRNCTDSIHKQKAAISLAIAQFIMHVLPIITITIIYKPSIQIQECWQNEHKLLESISDNMSQSEREFFILYSSSFGYENSSLILKQQGNTKITYSNTNTRSPESQFPKDLLYPTSRQSNGSYLNSSSHLQRGRHP